MPKNQGLYVPFTLKTKKRTLFLTFTRRFENLRKVPSFLKKAGYFWRFFEILPLFLSANILWRRHIMKFQ